ncbi:MAG: histidine triad nucleotide-binding protein [Candidatus Puniceispirillum sp.]|jgi:diadenosine tetraphosphate (Ap4A) HIT family hydrolase
MAYDDNNIFARILRGEIPCQKIDETEHTLSFRDINPQAPVHVLVIPKGRYIDWSDFMAQASDAEIIAFNRAISRAADITGIADTGYRVISNCGNDSHQEVPHLHMHVLGGHPVGPLVMRRD